MAWKALIRSDPNYNTRMADTFRALCAELVDIITAHANPDDYAVGDIAEMLARARAALAKADEPAVPEEGREPAAVITEPSDEEGPSVEEVEELCEEHCFNVEGYESIECLQGLINEAIARWGNLKGSLTSSPPADGEVADRAAELLQQQALVPVPASERLPGPEDCVPHPRTKRGNWCWGFERCEVPLARPARWRLMHMEADAHGGGRDGGIPLALRPRPAAAGGE